MPEAPTLEPIDDSVFDERPARKPTTQPTLQGLFDCPDCGNKCSRSAVSCPHCGRLVRVYPLQIDRSGWSITIALGIVLALVIPWLVMAVMLFMVASALSTVSPR